MTEYRDNTPKASRSSSAMESERAVLGSALVGRGLPQTPLVPDDFSLDSHRRIFGAMRRLEEREIPIDAFTLRGDLEVVDDLERVGGSAYIDSLTDLLPLNLNIEHHAGVIAERAARHHVAVGSERLQRLALDPSVSAAALSGVANSLSEVASGGDPIPPRFSEESLALRFSRQYAGDLRYVAGWGRWLFWDGTRWREDGTLSVYDRARGICRNASAECGDAEKGTAARLAAAATVAAVEKLARADRRHAATVEQWDSDAWLLNTPGGTIDLRTGELQAHQREQYLTRLTAAGPSGDCPLWLRFLHRAADGNTDLQLFLQRVIGYCMTGVTREHALFFMYGTGANGKSVFLSTVAALLADYAKTAPASAFTASNTEQHPTDLAGLRGARFVTAIETEDGRWWAESKIKSLTGGDRIAARYMRQDFFEYIPQFKLIVAGNHKPGLRNVDEAIRRRLHLIPFTVTIPEAERDPELAEKLKAEYPGILQWAIEGCLAWQREGLKPPAIVRNATAEYLAAEDAVGRWLDDCCLIGKRHWTSAAALFTNWQSWCERTGERPGTQKRFTQALESRGIYRERTERARGFGGIGLLVDVPDTSDTSSYYDRYARARERPI